MNVLKKSIIFMPLIMVLFFFNINSHAQDDSLDKILATQPGEKHNILLNFVGKFRVLASLFSNEEPPAYGKGESINKVILDGRYIEFESIIEMTGYNIIYKYIIGYDNIKKKYSMYSIDNLSTNQLIAFGDFDRKNREIVFKGKFESILNDQTGNYSVRIKFVDDRKFEIDFYLGEGKEEFHRMKSVYILQDR